MVDIYAVRRGKRGTRSQCIEEVIDEAGSDRDE